MHAHAAPPIYATLHSASPVRDVLDLIARHAPRLMRVGGMLGVDSPARPPNVTAALREEMARLLVEGVSINEIARRIGLHYTTVARHTRHLRPAGPQSAALVKEAQRKRHAYTSGYRRALRGLPCDPECCCEDFMRGAKAGAARRAAP